MSRPFVLVQLSDPHIGADWAPGDPVAGLAAAIASVRRLRPPPDAVLVSGDLADRAWDAEYAQVVSLLEPLDAPHYVLCGNHDDRDALRRHFGPPGPAGAPLQYTADLGALRLVVLDSTIPGADAGVLGPDRLAWLDRVLAADRNTPTVLAMHHPPLATHVPALDAVGLADPDRAGLAGVVGGHANVALIVGGHFHRAISGELAGHRVLVAPSTYAGFALELASDGVEPMATPPGYVVHVLRDGTLVSHIEPVQT